MRPTHQPYLLSGSFAYDTILRHDGLFQSSILPDALSRLSVSFDIGASRTEFGGTGGNIAYTAALLRQYPCLVGSVGHDAEKYLHHLGNQGHVLSTLTRNTDIPTAHAWISSDAADNQMTFFHMGAMNASPDVPDLVPALWHLAPENPLTTAALAKRAITSGIDYFFDPGQVTPAFVSGQASGILPLEDMLYQAKGIFVNDYEAGLLCSKTGKPLSHWIAEEGQFIVHTRGGEGLDLYVMGYKESLPVAPAERIVDPTGCGDALRAGFLFGYTQGWSLRDCALLGAVMGSFAIEQVGGQKHKPTLGAIAGRLDEVCKRAASGVKVQGATLTWRERPLFDATRRDAWVAAHRGTSLIDYSTCGSR